MAAPLLLPKARAVELGPERALALRPRLAGPFLGRHRRNARRASRVRAGRNGEQYEKLDYRCASIYVRLSTTQGGNNVYFLRNLGSLEGDNTACSCG